MKRGLLIGAGFSYDLGMPLAVEVTEVFLNIFNTKNARQFADVLASKEPFGKDRPINRTAIHEGMHLLLAYKQEDGRNYEEFLARLEALPWKTQSDQDSRHYLFSIFYDLLYKILVAYQNESYDTMYELNSRWFSKLANLLSSEETWAFTLNHDLYFECLAIDLGIPVTYGDVDEIAFPISNLKPNNKIRLSCMQRELFCTDGRGWFAGTNGINLVRLHGGFCELEYKDKVVICNPSLQRKRSSELISEFRKIESMGYYVRGEKVPSGRDRVITGPDGTLDVIHRGVLAGGNKYSKTTNFKKGEEKLKLFSDVLKGLDELTIIGYGFGDVHVNYRISNAMVLNEGLKIRIIDPVQRRWPEFLRQFDYDLRIRGAYCGAAQWMAYVGEEKWDEAQMKGLKENERLRSEVRHKVEVALSR